jgi:UPF0755 protein
MLRKIKISLFVLFAGFLVWSVLLPKDFTSKDQIIFNIEKGQGARDISLNLEKAGLIQSGPLFRLYVTTLGVADQLQAGQYKISPSMSLLAIVKAMAEGDVAKETLTVIEGWSLWDIGKYLADRGLFQQKDLWALTGEPASNKTWPQDFSSQFGFLADKPKNVNLEGYLFPDTYTFKTQTTPESVVLAMLGNFDKKITAEMRAEIKRQGKTIFEIVTMASLIEKEVNTYEDKQIVSGVFWKRLNTGMGLDSCASIAYILGVDKWRYSYEDTRTPSPYNTYLNRGLPLGPIANPGLESIQAAIYPKASSYWYWLSTPEGQTIFSKTLEEHNIAKAKYLN